MAGEQVRASLAEMFLPSTLFASEIQCAPATYRTIRAFLKKHGAELQPNSSHRIIMKLTTTISSDSKDTNTAVDIV